MSQVFVTKKRTVISIALTVMFAFSVCWAAVSIKQSVAASKNGIVIVLDAGHGGIDGGVVGKTSGAKESDINLSLTKMTQHVLQKRGYTVYLTRKTSAGLYSLTASNKKLSDMQKRKEIIESVKPDLMISIHQNQYPHSSVKGAQVFYGDRQEKSEAYAKSVQNSLNAALSQTKSCKKADYYVLQCSPYPSLLIECGFLSNPQEEKLLTDPVYRQKLSEILATAVDALFFPSSFAGR